MNKFNHLKILFLTTALLIVNCLALGGGASSATKESENNSPLALISVLLGVPQSSTNPQSVGYTSSETVSSSATSTTTTSATSSTATASTPVWVMEAYLKAPNAEAGDYFGNNVDISLDTIVIAASGEDSNQTTITNGTSASGNNSFGGSGAAYVFKRNGSNWVQEAYLKASNANADDNFGTSVAISNDTIVVGAIFEDSNQTTISNGNTASANNSVAETGAAYVFKRSGATWAQEAYLKAPNANSTDYFGITVAISNDTIVVGAWHEDSNQTTITNGTNASADNSISDSGAAYVFKRNGSTWAQEAYLKTPNPNTSDQFSQALAIDSDTIVIGAFREDSNQTTITNGTTASSDNSALDAGAAYVFKRSGTSWTLEAYLKASNSGAGDLFGIRVAISSDTIVVEATEEDSNQTTITNGASASSDNSRSNSGAVYVFKRNGSIWVQEAYIKASNSDADDFFGNLVDISLDTIVASATHEDSNQTTITNGSTASADNSIADSGAIYVFKRSGSIWTQEAYLKAPNANSNDQLGNALAISSNTVVVGSMLEDSAQTTITNGTTASSDNSATDSGAVYVFVRK